MAGFRKTLKSLFKLKKLKRPAGSTSFSQVSLSVPAKTAKPEKRTKKSFPPSGTEQPQTKEKYTPEALRVAAREGKLGLVEGLLAQKQSTPADIERALIGTANCGHADIITLLLRQGVANINVNATNYHGETALHRAIHGGHGKCVRVLIEHGADPFLGSPSAIDLAERLWNARPLALFKEIIDEQYPGRLLELMTIEQHVKKQEAADDAEEQVAPQPTKRRASPSPRRYQGTEGYASSSLWPDRVVIRKGKQAVIPPSDPSYWY